MRGDRLKSLRNSKKLTQEQLGKIINVTKVSISGYESGNRSPDTETLTKLADYFDVSTDYLLGRSDEERPYSQKFSKEDLAILEFSNTVEGAWFKKLPESDEEVIEAFRTLYYLYQDRKKKDE